ncbi:hypothetical protein B0H16DRAFT_1719839 [Mycena metata]|uniref:Uncharacterized protein n=1 Tax=Mycena metata TaxID=1033252 RepID=A0AAD7JB93_9AGAR|nr:hypothetical protein B0H16DRAFT_1719839 [Mycena metata]
MALKYEPTASDAFLMPSPLCRLFWMPELSDAVLNLCTLEDLVFLSHSGPLGREVFTGFFALKLRLSLLRFFPPRYYDAVPALLVYSTFGQQRHDTASDLNIVSPRGTASIWIDFMVSINGEEVASDMDRRFLGKVKTYLTFKLPGVDAANCSVTVTVSECSSTSILPTVFRAADTSQMTMIDARRVVVPYRISLKGFYATGMHVADDAQYLTAGFDRFNPSKAKVPCGLACPYIGRDTLGFSGIREVAWRCRAGDVDGRRAFSHVWYLGRLCTNPFCDNYNKPFRL